MARTVAKRSSEPLRARVFCVCGILKQCRILSHALCHPGVRICFLWPFPGVPPLAGLHRRALLNFSGILLLFDVQSSTTEKEQKDRHLLFLRRGGARTPGWDYTRKIVRDPSLPVFQRLRVLSRIVDRNISILRTSEIENETELQYHKSV